MESSVSGVHTSVGRGIPTTSRNVRVRGGGQYKGSGQGAVAHGESRLLNQPPQIPLQLDANTLREAGISRDLGEPTQALIRAKRLAGQGHFSAAERVLKRHQHFLRGDDGYRVLSAQISAMVGGDWEDKFNRALKTVSSPRMRSQLQIALGDSLTFAGRFDDADKLFKAARNEFIQIKDRPAAAIAESYRARLRLRSGLIKHALVRTDRVLEFLGSTSAGRPVALARLERGLILAHFGRHQDAAKDILKAERILTPQSHPMDRVHARLVHAEALIVRQDFTRAAAALERVIDGQVASEHRRVKAEIRFLLGLAYRQSAPAKSRECLIRSVYLHQRLGLPFSAMRAQIALVETELLLGIDTSTRIHRLCQDVDPSWRSLLVELKVSQAKHIVDENAALARALLKDAFADSQNLGNIRLATYARTTAEILGLTPARN